MKKKKNNKYIEPKITVKKIKANFFYNRSRFYDSIDHLMGVEVIAQSGSSLCSCCGNTCLLPGTKILTSAGEVVIESLRIGDTIISYDPRQLVQFDTKITSILSHYRDDGYVILNQKLRITRDHPVWIPDKYMWVPVEKISVGDALFDRNLNNIQVKSIDKINESVSTFALITENNTIGYFADQILVQDYQPAD